MPTALPWKSVTSLLLGCSGRSGYGDRIGDRIDDRSGDRSHLHRKVGGHDYSPGASAAYLVCPY